MRSAALALVLLLVFGSSARAAEELELDVLHSRIRESRERDGIHERKERALLEQLEESDRLSAALTREVRLAREAAVEAHRESERVAEAHERAGEQLVRTRSAMAKRVVALYKAGAVGPLRFVFGSASIPELLSRIAALETFVAYDARLVDRYRTEMSSLEALRIDAESALRVRDTAALHLEQRSAEFEAERTARRALLASVSADRTQERTLRIELEKAARALEETLAALGKAPSTDAERLVGQGFAARRGVLEAPLAAEIVQAFGKVIDEEFRTATFRKGVEFAAEGGESVRAVAPGIVRFAGWFRGYGRLVIVDQGDEYFTVMGHLAEIFVAVGDTVAEGSTLGTVGDTGSLAGPSLYFEIRHGAAPLDPVVWFTPHDAVRAAGLLRE